MTTPRRVRLRYSYITYYVWYILAASAACASVLTGPIAGAWGWSLGWAVGALALSAHARLERLDGHSHDGSRVNVP